MVNKSNIDNQNDDDDDVISTSSRGSRSLSYHSSSSESSNSENNKKLSLPYPLKNIIESDDDTKNIRKIKVPNKPKLIRQKKNDNEKKIISPLIESTRFFQNPPSPQKQKEQLDEQQFISNTKKNSIINNNIDDNHKFIDIKNHNEQKDTVLKKSPISSIINKKNSINKEQLTTSQMTLPKEEPLFIEPKTNQYHDDDEDSFLHLLVPSNKKKIIQSDNDNNDEHDTILSTTLSPARSVKSEVIQNNEKKIISDLSFVDVFNENNENLKNNIIEYENNNDQDKTQFIKMNEKNENHIISNEKKDNDDLYIKMNQRELQQASQRTPYSNELLKISPSKPYESSMNFYPNRQNEVDLTTSLKDITNITNRYDNKAFKELSSRNDNHHHHHHSSKNSLTSSNDYKKHSKRHKKFFNGEETKSNISTSPYLQSLKNRKTQSNESLKEYHSNQKNYENSNHHHQRSYYSSSDSSPSSSSSEKRNEISSHEKENKNKHDDKQQHHHHHHRSKKHHHHHHHSSSSLSSSEERSGKRNDYERHQKQQDYNIYSEEKDMRTKILQMEEQKEKREIYYELFQFEKAGYAVNKKYSLDDDISELRFEYNRLMKEKDIDEKTKIAWTLFQTANGIIEYANNKLNPFNFSMKGWSDEIDQKRSEYEPHFRKIYKQISLRLQISPSLMVAMLFGTQLAQFIFPKLLDKLNVNLGKDKLKDKNIMNTNNTEYPWETNENEESTSNNKNSNTSQYDLLYNKLNQYEKQIQLNQNLLIKQQKLIEKLQNSKQNDENEEEEDDEDDENEEEDDDDDNENNKFNDKTSLEGQSTMKDVDNQNQTDLKMNSTSVQQKNNNSLKPLKGSDAIIGLLPIFHKMKKTSQENLITRTSDNIHMFTEEPTKPDYLENIQEEVEKCFSPNDEVTIN